MPAAPEITDVGALLDVVDGIVLTGARANVHPTRFNVAPTPSTSPTTIKRDEVALALVEACVTRGIPLFGICRGLQEMNVAFGGSLHPEIREIAGTHEPPHAPARERRNPSRSQGDLRRPPRGQLAGRAGCSRRSSAARTIRVNSLHGQGILEPGKRVVIEGIAEDGTIEAISIADAPGFALGVQWHAEYDPQRNPINRKLFQAFGAALTAHAKVGATA